MNHENDTNRDSRGGLPIDELTLLSAADGELSESEMARVESAASADPALASRLEHERRLREAVGRAMGADASAPEGLRERLAQAMAAVGDDELETASGSPDAGAIRTNMGDTRDRSFWTRMPAFLAVAATLTLVASVLIVSFSMSRPLYDDKELGARVVSFIRDEHNRCADFGDRFERKFLSRSLDEARKAANDHIGSIVGVLTLDPKTWADASLEFVGYGPCALPGTPKSGHILFRHTGSSRAEAGTESGTESGAVVLSLFVALDDGTFSFASSSCCYVAEGSSDGDTIVAWRREGLVYFLYSPESSAMQAARSALGTPENVRRLL